MLKRVFLVILTIVFMTGIIGLGGCESEERQRQYGRDRIKEITEIEVPSDSIILYHCRDDATFLNGRRAQYTVFEFKSEPTDWLKESAFLEGRDKDFEMYFTSTLGFLPVEIEEIPKEFIPNFESDYIWVVKQNVYFFYSPRKLMLIVHIIGH